MSKSQGKRKSSSDLSDRARTSVKRKKAKRLIDGSAKHVSVTPIDKLAWREITPPDGFKDAEGLMGLEEVDDVEVLRDLNGGPVHFRTLTPSTHHLSDNVVHERQHGIGENHASDADGEWCGFSDTECRNSTKDQEKAPLLGSNAIFARKRNGSHDDALQTGIHAPFELLNNVSQADEVDMTEWNQLPLSDDVVSAIASLGFSQPTPIQKAVIPEIVAGHDLIGKAVTGSGKTLAFAIPIFQDWHSRASSHRRSNTKAGQSPMSLVLTPTRELAHQVSRHFEDLVRTVAEQPNIVRVTGGLSVHKQTRQLANADIVIATPGRFWELLTTSEDVSREFSRIKFLVLDEADRLLSEGHFQELESILERLKYPLEGEEDGSEKAELCKRQTLIFSATLSRELQSNLASSKNWRRQKNLTEKASMAYLLQKVPFGEQKPIFIDVNSSSQMAQRLREGILECPAMEKDLYLYCTLTQKPRARILVFTNSISAVRRLTLVLKNLNLLVNALHSDMAQKARLRNVERFSQMGSSSEILVATDVAARGLDIQNINLIVHYHVPRTAEAYIHRSGRTARSDNAGESILLCSPDETAGVTRLIGQVHKDSSTRSKEQPLQPVSINQQLLTQLRLRIKLSQKITEATSRKEKAASQDGWLRTTAEELGVDYDSEDFAAEEAKRTRGRARGAVKKKNGVKQRQGLAATTDDVDSRGTTGAVLNEQISSWKRELNDLLNKKIINLSGVNERYLAGGGVDVSALLHVDVNKNNNEGIHGRSGGGRKQPTILYDGFHKGKSKQSIMTKTILN